MKVLSFLLVFVSTVFAQDKVYVLSISNDDSAQYFRIYFDGDSIKADYNRMKPDRAVQEFFNFVAAAKYRTTTNFFVGDTVMALTSEEYNNWQKGVLLRESESGRLLVRIKWVFEECCENRWFDPENVEAYVP